MWLIVGNVSNSATFFQCRLERCVDPKISMIPVRIINFVTRTVIGTIWGQFLHVAKQVQNGERVNHKDAIQKQPELYRFIEQRVQDLFSNCRRIGGQDTTPTDTGTRSDEINEANFEYVAYLQN